MLGALSINIKKVKKKVFADFEWLFDRWSLHLDGGTLSFIKYTTQKRKRMSVASLLMYRGPRLRTHFL